MYKISKHKAIINSNVSRISNLIKELTRQKT